MPSREYLTPQEVVDRFKSMVTIKTLANWRCSGVGPPFTRVGGKILYPLTQLESWEESRTVTSTSEYGAA